METQILESYTEYCKKHIETEIHNYEAQTYYTCDLATYLTERINANGSATFSTYLAKEYIKEWWNDASDYYQYEVDNFGENIHNPFERPEAFHVCMIVQGVQQLLSEVSIIQDNWNDRIELTKKVIEQILSEVEHASDVCLI